MTFAEFCKKYDTFDAQKKALCAMGKDEAWEIINSCPNLYGKIELKKIYVRDGKEKLGGN